MRQNVVVFTENGHTFTFRNVHINVDNESTLQFSYKAMSDGNSKVGTFSKSRIVGHSVFYD